MTQQQRQELQEDLRIVRSLMQYASTDGAYRAYAASESEILRKLAGIQPPATAPEGKEI